MNKLEMAVELREMCGLSGADATTVGARGEWLVLINAIKRAWEDIQRNRPDWLWMRKTVSFTTIAAQGEYSYSAAPLSLTDFGAWDTDTFRLYNTSVADELFLNYVKYAYFRDYWLFGTSRTINYQPYDFTISPTKSIIFGPAPDAAYTVTADYLKTPSTLDSDSSEPDMPARFHMLIVYEAMKFIGMRESGVELFEYARMQAAQLKFDLELDQLPEITISR